MGTLSDGTTVTNCYSIGIVTSSGNNVGGFIGNDSGFINTSCFYDTQTTGQANGIGTGDTSGITGKTTAEMKTKSVFTDAGWDFTDVWDMNGSYPYLRALGNNYPVPLEHNVTYKNYDGSDITNLNPSLPTTYFEGEGVTLPTTAPNDDMAGWEFLGYWDSPIDSQTFNLTAGNKITEISTTATGNITLYARYTSAKFEQWLPYKDAFIYAPEGVFPNGATANITVLEPGTSEYETLFQQLDNKESVENIKIIEIDIFDSSGNKIQPNSFFGNATIGVKLPEDFSTDDIKLVRIITGGADVELVSKSETIDDTLYIEAETNHFSPYALVQTKNATENNNPSNNTVNNTTNNITNNEIGPYTGDKGMTTVLAVLLVSVIGLAILVRYRRTL